jgi:hypothetical protein
VQGLRAKSKTLLRPRASRVRIGLEQFAVTSDTVAVSPGSRFRTAMMIAIIADAVQIVIFPFFVEGALSPAEDILDFGVGALLVNLLGWHWEFLPSFLAKLVPGVDLVPMWTMAVANVYRKTKRMKDPAEESVETQSALGEGKIIEGGVIDGGSSGQR